MRIQQIIKGNDNQKLNLIKTLKQTNQISRFKEKKKKLIRQKEEIMQKVQQLRISTT